MITRKDLGGYGEKRGSFGGRGLSYPSQQHEWGIKKAQGGALVAGSGSPSSMNKHQY